MDVYRHHLMMIGKGVMNLKDEIKKGQAFIGVDDNKYYFLGFDFDNQILFTTLELWIDKEQSYITKSNIFIKEILEEKGINVRVADIHTIKPIDKNLIVKCAKETKRIITIEDHNIIGGLGSAICEVLSEEYPCLVTRMGIKDAFGKSGKAEELMKYFKIDAEAIVNEIVNG